MNIFMGRIYVQCFVPLRATTFDERTNISTMNITDDGNSQTCKYSYSIQKE